MSASTKRLHIVRKYPCGGGMQAILDHHHGLGEPIIGITGDSPSAPGIQQLQVMPGTSLREASRRLRSAMEKHPEAECLFYNACALEWLSGKLPGQRHVIYLHSDYPGLSPWLQRLLPAVDGCLCVGSQAAGKVEALVPDRPGFVHTVPLPIEPLLPENGLLQEADSPLVIGYAGRVEVAQKRLDRLPGFLEAMDRTAIGYRMEILGEGRYLPQLKSRLSGRANLHFHGHKESAEYWRILSRWKYILFLSDYEGFPIALLEGIAAGAIPVYPQLRKGHARLDELKAAAIYPTGDVGAAAASIAGLEKTMDANSWDKYHRSSAGFLEKHTPAGYHAAMDVAIGQIRILARPAREQKPGLPGWLPFWMHNRLRRYRQFGTLRPVAGI